MTPFICAGAGFLLAEGFDLMFDVQIAHGRTGQPAWADPLWKQWRRDQVTALVRKDLLRPDSALIAGDDMKSIGKRRKKPAVGFGIETVGVREQNRAPARIRPFEARHRAISEIDGLSHRI